MFWRLSLHPSLADSKFVKRNADSSPLKCLQARAFYGFQIAIENIHSGDFIVHPVVTGFF